MQANQLTVADLRSGTWQRLEQWLVLKRADLREDNDRKTKDATDTAFTRGRIEQCKEMLALRSSLLSAGSSASPSDELAAGLGG